MKHNKNRSESNGADSARAEIASLYDRLVELFYDAGDYEQAEPIAQRLHEKLVQSPELSASIRCDEIRSILAELRGDLPEAARSREAEIRKILELHSAALNTSSWKYVSQQYDFSDVSDRLDLLAILYDKQGDLDRAIATLRESSEYCQSHNIEFDGQDLLDELDQPRRAAPD